MLIRHALITPSRGLHLSAGPPLVLELPTGSDATSRDLEDALGAAEAAGGVEGLILRPRSGLRGAVDLSSCPNLHRLLLQDTGVPLERVALHSSVRVLQEFETRAGRAWPDTLCCARVVRGACSGAFEMVGVESSDWFRIARCKRLREIRGRFEWLGVESCPSVKWSQFAGRVRSLELRGAVPEDLLEAISRGGAKGTLLELTLAGVRRIAKMDPLPLRALPLLRKITLDAGDMVMNRWRESLDGTGVVVARSS